MKYFLSVEVTFEDDSIKDKVALGKALHHALSEFVAGDGDNLIPDEEVIEALEFGVSSVPDPCSNDGVIRKVQEILGGGAPRSCCQLANGAKAVLKFCEEYKCDGPSR